MLSYKQLGELISLDDFDSVYAALDYCRREKIEDPVEIRRVEIIEERMLDRSQIEKLLNIR